jgi:hypothetical protein
MVLDDRTNGSSRPKREFLTMATMTKPKKEKTAHPVVKVSVYDSEEHERTNID